MRRMGLTMATFNMEDDNVYVVCLDASSCLAPFIAFSEVKIPRSRKGFVSLSRELTEYKVEWGLSPTMRTAHFFSDIKSAESAIDELVYDWRTDRSNFNIIEVNFKKFVR